MRTTIRLNDELLSTAKTFAAATGLTLTALIEEALRQRLALAANTRRGPIRLITSGEGGVCAGIDLDDSSSLMDAMDQRLDPD